MGEMETMVQTEVMIDGESSVLAQDQDLDDLRRRIEEATATTGRFVDFVVVGNRTVIALVTPRTRVVFRVSTVQFDPRDTGDVDFPYGGHYDLL
ncbi:hypothetical protein [Microbacterium aurantiacum]|uniref:hypothetical protein n=1 Tax=Microbacterium aurantiacum TaxID=162393 RepID=UPI001FE74B73|nr:hypothetical protein [Microbacterium aurantiacum]